MASSKRVLFACTLNAIRSPMAEGILSKLGNFEVESCGVHAETVDPFGVAACLQKDIDISDHITRTFEELPRSLPFDLTITLSDLAFEAAKSLPKSFTGEVLFWPMAVPADRIGNRDQQIMAYAKLRDDLTTKIQAYFFGETVSTQQKDVVNG